MRMTMYEFEGTPSEIAQIKREMNEGSLPELASDDAAPPLAQNELQRAESDQFVPENVARLALARRPLSTAQRIALDTLYAAGPNWVLASELQDVTGYTPSQFAGLMGAFGRRVSHTRGYRSGQWFFDYRWDETQGCYKYRVPPAVRAAMESLGIVP